MSLLRLLTTGKSLVDVRSTETRYRVTTQRLLPKFGSARTPFRGGARPSSGPAPSTTGGVSEPSSLRCASQPVAPEVGPTPTALARYTLAARNAAWAVWQRMGARLRGWKAKVSERIARPPRKSGKAAIPRFDKPAVQGELSLDRVKVVRNDLSDTDLEIVPANPKAAPVAPAAEPTGVAGAIGLT